MPEHEEREGARDHTLAPSGWTTTGSMRINVPVYTDGRINYTPTGGWTVAGTTSTFGGGEIWVETASAASVTIRNNQVTYNYPQQLQQRADRMLQLLEEANRIQEEEAQDETPAERAERVNRERREERARVEAAADRGMELLRSVLNPEERHRFNETGEVRVTGQSGIEYQLLVPNGRPPARHDADNGGYVGNVVPMFQGHRMGRYCVHLNERTHDRGVTITWDHFAGQVLGLKYNEAEFMAKANYHNNIRTPPEFLVDNRVAHAWTNICNTFQRRQGWLKDAFVRWQRQYGSEQDFRNVAAEWLSNPPCTGMVIPEPVLQPQPDNTSAITTTPGRYYIAAS